MTTVTVIGAGVIGFSLADELTRRGANVTIVDAAEAGSGTSAATFAWINSNDKSPVEYSHLNVLGLEAHERSLARGGHRWFHQTGTLQIAQTPTELGVLEQKVERLSGNGYAAHMITAQRVQELEPHLVARDVVGGAMYPREGWTDVQTMCLTLIDRAIAGGATFAPYESVTDLGTNTVTTATDDGVQHVHHADVTVLAAGNGNRRILAHHGLTFPTLEPHTTDDGPARGGIISTTGPVRRGPSRIIRANGIAMRPARNGGVTFADHPTGGKWDFDSPEIWTVPGLLLERARQLYPDLTDTFTETVALGTRVLPTDGLTIADWVDTDEQRVYAVATHSGVTLAAHLAEAVSDEVLTGQRHPSLANFGLSRFADAG